MGYELFRLKINFKYKLCRALALESIRRFLAKIKKVSNTLFKGQDLLKPLMLE